jgi:hypothetical protein
MAWVTAKELWLLGFARVRLCAAALTSRAQSYRLRSSLISAETNDMNLGLDHAINLYGDIAVVRSVSGL